MGRVEGLAGHVEGLGHDVAGRQHQKGQEGRDAGVAQDQPVVPENHASVLAPETEDDGRRRELRAHHGEYDGGLPVVADLPPSDEVDLMRRPSDVIRVPFHQVQSEQQKGNMNGLRSAD